MISTRERKVLKHISKLHSYPSKCLCHQLRHWCWGPFVANVYCYRIGAEAQLWWRALLTFPSCTGERMSSHQQPKITGVYWLSLMCCVIPIAFEKNHACQHEFAFFDLKVCLVQEQNKFHLALESTRTSWVFFFLR